MNNQKYIFWIKWIMLAIVALFLGAGYVTFDPYWSGICDQGNDCMFLNWRKNISEPVFLASLFISISLIFSFFISTRTFKKWLMFIVIWLVADIIWVINSPVISHYYFDIGPTTKESVSIWMGFFLVFSSLAMFIVSKMRNTPLWKKWIYGILIFIAEVILVFMFS